MTNQKDHDKEIQLFKRFLSILVWYMIGFVGVMFSMEYLIRVNGELADFSVLFIGIGTFLLILGDLMDIRKLLQ
jgi:energy-converting hydrogenase Eha subunit C